VKDNGVNDSKEAWSVSHIFVWPFAFALIHLHLYTSVGIYAWFCHLLLSFLSTEIEQSMSAWVSITVKES
jgi:hypothetical protein